MKKKLFTTIISFFVFLSCITQPTWHIIDSPINEDLVSLCFIDDMTGWIISEQGTLLKTLDGGQTWQSIAVGNGRFTSLYFTSQTHGCITAYQENSLIYLTNDGGSNWQLVEHPLALRLNDVYFANSSIGWAVGIADNMNYNIYTNNGGMNWAEQMDIFVMDAELYSVSFRDENIGSTCGQDGNFFVTNSGGTTGWSMDISIPSLGINLYGLINWSDLNGCAVGSSGTALITTNTWAQYTETVTNTSETLNAVGVDIETDKLWAVGESGTIIYTPNYLLGWVNQNSGVTNTLNDIDVINENNIWAVGDAGTILHFTEGSFITDQNSFIYNIYPNPTHDLINIEMNKEQDDIQFQLIDFTGKLLMNNDISNSSRYQIDLSHLPQGIYFIKIISDNKTITKKICRL